LSLYSPNGTPSALTPSCSLSSRPHQQRSTGASTNCIRTV